MKSPRFFAVTVFGGRLYVHGLAAGDPWDEARLEYRSKRGVDIMTLEPSWERAVHTAEELHEILCRLSPELPTQTLWVHEAVSADLRTFRDRVRRPRVMETPDDGPVISPGARHEALDRCASSSMQADIV